MKTKYAHKILTLLGIIAIALSLATNAHAAWYTAKVKNVAPSASTGDVFVQIRAGTGETRFVDPVSRGIVNNDSPGANKIMAVLLTAMSLNSEVLILMDNDPSWANAQIIKNVGLEAP